MNIRWASVIKDYPRMTVYVVSRSREANFEFVYELLRPISKVVQRMIIYDSVSSLYDHVPCSVLAHR